MKNFWQLRGLWRRLLETSRVQCAHNTYPWLSLWIPLCGPKEFHLAAWKRYVYYAATQAGLPIGNFPGCSLRRYLFDQLLDCLDTRAPSPTPETSEKSQPTCRRPKFRDHHIEDNRGYAGTYIGHAVRAKSCRALYGYRRVYTRCSFLRRSGILKIFHAAVESSPLQRYARNHICISTGHGASSPSVPFPTLSIDRIVCQSRQFVRAFCEYTPSPPERRIQWLYSTQKQLATQSPTL